MLLQHQARQSSYITVADFTRQIDEIFVATNEQRKRKGLSPLVRNDQLMIAAGNYASLMASVDTLSHDVNGQPLEERIAAAQYVAQGFGENIAMSAILEGKSIVIEQWMTSKMHKRNILNPGYTQIGIGIAGPSKHEKAFYYCQIFGRPK